ncbi:MAG: GNAT family N-acetyltransferase [Blastocatellia bacterium]|nr:GNAT family N-acetyltransferase [Blastocatellia bacterium]MCS7156625.1 GNAT family N-acetyltransferase [Blastocatellia bacterium]MCX7751633.1 GNAT family N-acetyltransferase [Blastocatellia bacterium]MDW8168733.1 N-acetyltransferase [Acidobacteriota bacterium]MDW8256999.1 N-acetyltransferase [Acidobacteriota bacterium]
MILRDYRPEDFARLCEIDRLCFPQGIAYTTEEMRLYLADRRAFTIVAEGPQSEIVGFLIARLEIGRLPLERAKVRIGHLVTIDVHPDWQRRGIGSLLLQEAERRLHRAGARAVLLETAVDNIPAIRFYAKHGYVVLERIRGYYLGEKDALRMGKRLEDTNEGQRAF